MARELLIATRNQKKKTELQEVLAGWDLRLISLDQIETMPEVEEDGATFSDNAIKKARTIAEASGMITLADDSGLVVDALDGAPGIFSARFAGPGCTDEDNNARLLELLRGVPEPQRLARFVCVIAVAVPGGGLETVSGICEGQILLAPRGNKGFGYDPLFLPAGCRQTFAEIDSATKNLISHRGRALQAVKLALQRLLDTEGWVC
ncbi:MAG: XTP/dITP diphosphatase [Syntrophomonas sp.]|nr:XTP/dITP diphosphatase [Syntrophomonas sp.]